MIRIICFGKIKDTRLEQIANAYLKRAGQLGKIELLELKNQNVEEKIRTYKSDHSQQHIFLLGEEGRTFTSKKFASLIKSHNEEHITFIIGPAEGFSNKLKEDIPLISLSPLTMMHELAQVVLLEQLYRALSINKGLPYHKA